MLVLQEELAYLGKFNKSIDLSFYFADLDDFACFAQNWRMRWELVRCRLKLFVRHFQIIGFLQNQDGMSIDHQVAELEDSIEPYGQR